MGELFSLIFIGLTTALIELKLGDNFGHKFNYVLYDNNKQTTSLDCAVLGSYTIRYHILQDDPLSLDITTCEFARLYNVFLSNDWLFSRLRLHLLPLY